MNTTTTARPGGRTFVVSLDNRKPRGLGHERADEILVAARELFLKHGVDSVTTRQIAAAVGISQTALYVYFATKEQMLERLVELAWRALDQTLDEADDPALDPVERLRRQLAASMRFWLDRPDDFRIVFARKILRTCSSRTDPPADESTRGFSGKQVFARLTERVEEAEKSGALRRLGPCQSTALAVWTTIWGLVGLRLGFPEFAPMPIDKQIALTLDLIFNGCAARSAPAAAATAG